MGIETRTVYQEISKVLYQAEVNFKEANILWPKGVPSELGKRRICGIAMYRVKEDGKKEVKYTSGKGYWLNTVDGNTEKVEVDFGCGNEVLSTKAADSKIIESDPEATGITTCCGKDMTLEVPAALPSSD